MPKTYSLAYLTAAPLSAVDTISVAARCGYAAVGLRAIPATPDGADNGLLNNPAVIRDVRAHMKDTGVTVFDVEIVRLAPDFAIEAFKPFLDVCGALDARAILVAGNDPDEARMTANYAAFCDAAAPYGLTADLEFMPWTNVPNARAALRIVQAAGRPNGGILVDTLHAARSGTSIADIAAIPADLLHYAQICDAPAAVPTTLEGLLHTARQERLLPGSGGIPLAAMFAALRRDVPVSIELPNDKQKAALGVEAWCQQAITAARAVLEPTA